VGAGPPEEDLLDPSTDRLFVCECEFYGAPWFKDHFYRVHLYYMAMNEKPIVVPGDTGAYTTGVATCFAVCMYAWHTNTFPYEDYDGSYCIAMMHVPAITNMSYAMDVCAASLAGEGYGAGLKTVIIGGQPETMYHLHEIGQVARSRYGLECIVAPLTTNHGGATAVFASSRGVMFDVYDEEDGDDLSE
jgi:hypothetical protein